MERIGRACEMFPLIYHHSGRKNRRFRQAMRRMSQLMEESGRAAKPR